MISGIYAIINLVNGDMYIGSSGNVHKRYKAHQGLLKRRKHHSIYMQRAWDKYGDQAFTFVILLQCEPDLILQKELEFFKSYNPKYNIAKSPASPMKDRKHKWDTIQKMKNRTTPKGYNHHNYGKKLNTAHIQKIVNARTGSTHTEETKNKMRTTAKKLNRYKDLIPAIERNKRKVIDSDGRIFNSMVECSKYHKISIQTVCDILKGRHNKTRSGVSFKYHE